MSSKKDPLPTERDEMSASDPFAWVYFARTLTFSGNIIFQKYESWRKTVSDGINPRPPLGDLYEGSSNIVLNLYGLALENLVKGLLIAEGTPPFVNGKWNPELDRHHDLKIYFHQANVSTTSEEKQLLTLLSDAIQAGKFPVAKNAKIRQNAFPYLRNHSCIADMRPDIMLLLKKVAIEMQDQLRVKGRLAGNIPMDLESIGMDS